MISSITFDSWQDIDVYWVKLALNKSVGFGTRYSVPFSDVAI